MAHFLSGSRLKIKRANKHIADLNSMLSIFSNSDFYGLSIENDAKQGTNFLRIEVDESGFPMDDAVLIIGDALHNLRSALDHLYYKVVIHCGGKPTQWTRFPIFDSGDYLVTRLDSALEKKQITVPVARQILDVIKPYQTGNPALWSLHQLNITDKHEMFVPVLKLMQLSDVSLEDDQHIPLEATAFYFGQSGRVRLRDADDRKVTVKDKGHAAAAVLFDVGMPFQGEAVIPTLQRISVEVAGTVEAFELLLGKT
jgi:hypothetical protein